MELLDLYNNAKYTSDMVSGYALHFLADDMGFKHVISFGDYRLMLRLDFEASIIMVNSHFGYEPKHGIEYDGEKIHYRPHKVNSISVRVLDSYVIIANHDFKTLGGWIESYYHAWHPNEINNER